MATYYVDSAAAGAGTGADWANAFTSLETAFSGRAAGDIFYVAQSHVELPSAAKTLTSPGTAASPCQVICVNKAGSVPPVSADLATTAEIGTTGNNTLAIGAGYTNWYGIIFKAGSGAVNSPINMITTASGNRFKSCSFRKLGTTANSGAVQIGPAASSIDFFCELDNCSFDFGATGDGMRLAGRTTWRNTASPIVSTYPTNLFTTGQMPGTILVEGVDFSNAGFSGKTLVPSGATPLTYIFKDCKLHASLTVAATPTSPGRTEVVVLRSDSGDTNYKTAKYSYMGTQTVETTVVLTGGASDGTTPISWNLTTTANASRQQPFEALPITIWNDTTGSRTVTIQGIWGGGAVPNDDDIWMDIAYLGTSGFPLALFASTGPDDPLDTADALSAGAGTWGGSTTKFKMEKTITVNEKGPITVYIKAAKASSTFYIDPKITLS